VSAETGNQQMLFALYIKCAPLLDFDLLGMLRKFRRDERGVSIVVFGLTMPILIGATLEGPLPGNAPRAPSNVAMSAIGT